MKKILTFYFKTKSTFGLYMSINDAIILFVSGWVHISRGCFKKEKAPATGGGIFLCWYSKCMKFLKMSVTPQIFFIADGLQH